MFAPFSRSLVHDPNSDQVEETYVVGKRGRWTKTSSPVFNVEVRTRERDELDDFIPPRDGVERLRQYRELSRR